MSTDPIGLIGGVNLYSYVANNPVNYIDTEGKFVITATTAAIVIGGNAIAISLATPQGQQMLRDIIESIQVPSGPRDEGKDMSNTPESCRIAYEACKNAADITCGEGSAGKRRMKS